MADKITKLLAKLQSKQLRAILEVIVKLESNNMAGLDIKSLKGHPNKYRVRVGDIRIIFTVNKSGEKAILSIAKRNERTYKGL